MIVNEMMKVTFGYNDYQEFTNNGQGFANIAFVAVLLFWVAVIIFIIFFQNIILAIVGNAHDSARRNEKNIDSVVMYCFYLIVFYLKFSFNMAYFAIAVLCDEEDKTKSWMQRVAIRTYRQIIGEKLETLNWTGSLEEKWVFFMQHQYVIQSLQERFVDAVTEDLSLVLTGKLFELPEGSRLNVDLNILCFIPELQQSELNARFTDALKNSKKTELAGKNRLPARSLGFVTDTSDNKHYATIEIFNLISKGDVVVPVSGQQSQSWGTVTFCLQKDAYVGAVEEGEKKDMNSETKNSKDENVSKSASPRPTMKRDSMNRSLRSGSQRLDVHVEDTSYFDECKKNAIDVPEQVLDIFNEVRSLTDITNIFIQVFVEKTCSTGNDKLAAANAAKLAANDLFLVFRRSPIDKHTVFDRHLDDVSRNLFDSVDDFVDEVQTSSDSYMGGFRNSTVINHLERLITNNVDVQLVALQKGLSRVTDHLMIPPDVQDPNPPAVVGGGGGSTTVPFSSTSTETSMILEVASLRSTMLSLQNDMSTIKGDLKEIVSALRTQQIAEAPDTRSL